MVYPALAMVSLFYWKSVITSFPEHVSTKRGDCRGERGKREGRGQETKGMVGGRLVGSASAAPAQLPGPG